MATFTITIPDAHVQRALDAFASEYRHTSGPFATDTRQQFFKRQLLFHIKQVTKRYEQDVASKSAALPPDIEAT